MERQNVSARQGIVGRAQTVEHVQWLPLLVLSPEAIATVDVALARVGNTNVGLVEPEAKSDRASPGESELVELAYQISL